MTEHIPEHIPETDQSETSPPDAGPERTGVQVVDDVLDSMRGLDDRPVEEHPAVFESAHQQLRQALDGPAGA